MMVFKIIAGCSYHIMLFLPQFVVTIMLLLRTASPSDSPSYAPSTAPTASPSNSPTRMPTNDVDEIYDVRIQITYTVSALSETNKSWMTTHVWEIQEVLERNYLDTVNGASYETFWLAILELNDLDDGNGTVTLVSEIQCADTLGELMIARSQQSSFQFQVQSDLRVLLYNSALTFAVAYEEELVEVLKWQIVSVIVDDDSTVVIVIVIVAIVVLLAIAAVVVIRERRGQVKQVVVEDQQMTQVAAPAEGRVEAGGTDTTI